MTEKIKTPCKVGMKSSLKGLGRDRHDIWWYPKRCEYDNCTNDSVDLNELKMCASCSMVVYCSKEHQRDDWDIHKKDCKVFRRLNIQACFYIDAVILVKYPLLVNNATDTTTMNPTTGTQEQDDDDDEETNDACDDDDEADASIDENDTCKLCSKGWSDVRLKRTYCCKQVVCNNEDEYQMFSYSRQFCNRSHSRYTLCGYHGNERECKKHRDWRLCTECVKCDDPTRVADKLWRGLNSYNIYPMLAKDVPRHSLCETCSKCQKKFISGVEGSTHSREGISCPRCNPHY